MARGAVNIVEKHLEKGLLALAGLFLLAMVFLFLIRSPNKVTYGGRTVGPNELAEAIRNDARLLDEAVQKAQATPVNVPAYADELRAQHRAGIFAPAGDKPPLPEELPLAASFGPPLPELAEDKQPERSVTVVTPLAPSRPVARTGRNVVIPRRQEIGTEEEDEEDLADAEEMELAWVTVASYFDIGAQASAMTKANYATAASRVYFAGVDVQRQELLPSGQYSEWEDVANSTAMPQVELAEPLLDDATGAILNQDDIRESYQKVKLHQQMFAQPAFFWVVAGEEWSPPPLEGLLDPDRTDLATGDTARPDPKQDGQRRKKDAADDRETREKDRREAQAAAEKSLAAAEEAYRKADDASAERMARDVMRNKLVKASTRKRAELIVNSVAEMRRQEARKSAAGGKTDRPTPGVESGERPAITIAGESRTPGTAQPSGKKAEPGEKLLTHADNERNVVVWFHDDGVDAGKTYRYRMRVKLWNRYVGKRQAVADPASAQKSVLAGDWSLPCDAITVAPSTYFFVSSATSTRDGANVDVWKWGRTGWRVQSFVVGVGDVIGHVEQVETGILDRQTLKQGREAVDFSTGAIVLDLRFDERVLLRTSAGKGEFTLREVPSLVLVYLDPADGQVKERVMAFDRTDPRLRELEGGEEA